MTILERLRSMFTIPDLRNKLLFTLAMLGIYELVANIPLPGVDTTALANIFGTNGGSTGQVFNMLDLFSGGSLSRLSVVALGVYPYITASIIMQLLMNVIPKLSELQQEGESGSNKISQYTRIVAVPLALVQGYGQSVALANASSGSAWAFNFNLFSSATFLPTFTVLLTLAGGTLFLVWLGELITENGVGNGISLIIFAGIVSQLPVFISSGFAAATTGGQFLFIAVLLIIGLLTIFAIVYIYEAQRRIPVQYAKRMTRGGFLQGSSSFIPLQVNSAGMIPLIFAASIVLFPAVISSYFVSNPNPTVSSIATFISQVLSPSQGQYGGVVYWGLDGILVVLFTFFYAKVLFEQRRLHEQMQKNGQFIPGTRPGQPTADYLDRVLTRITLGGAAFLGMVAILPAFAQGFNASLPLSSTAVLIVVGVVLDTMKQLEAQMVMRSYAGFLR